MNTPQFQTRRPTCQPSWPLIILAGVEGSGKTWAAVEATGLPHIDRAFFLEVGENMADEYGAVPGADFEIIEHDGTFAQINGAAHWAGAQPAADGKVNLLIVDSMTEIWDLLTNEAQVIANNRRRGRRGDQEAQITMDLWNRAKDRLADFVGACRRFPGPVILTSRLEQVSIVEGSKPTGEKIWKVRCEKNLPYAATAIVQAREPRKWTLTKIASTRMQLPPGGEMALPEFSVAKLLEEMGIETQAAASTFVRPEAGGITTADRSRVEDLAAAGDMTALERAWKAARAEGKEELADLIAESAHAARERVKREGRGAASPTGPRQSAAPVEGGVSAEDRAMVKRLADAGDSAGLKQAWREAKAAGKSELMGLIVRAGKEVEQRRASAQVTDSHPDEPVDAEIVEQEPLPVG
ncbi:hypothetical protein [Corynebacterium sp. TAE3-ERU16]|uniref:hypothetical protein n=1 Tax=Corynebacterium sp. TAE3-ERU16 TaxID=2849493 RepID=UPI001C462035|nr:hypothetical protein [Corynebacterium sp. TAE3-ERU16]